MEHQIKNAKYEGYLWQSDQSKPRIIEEGEPLSLILTDGENPFVVEGLLWNPEENTSIQIRYVDGNYFVTTYEVKQEELDGSATTTPVTYLPHRLPGVKALKFLRQWMSCVKTCLPFSSRQTYSLDLKNNGGTAK